MGITVASPGTRTLLVAERPDSATVAQTDNPVVQRGFRAKSPEEIVYLSEEERVTFVLAVTTSVRNAVLRLADEVDALKLDSAP